MCCALAACYRRDTASHKLLRCKRRGTLESRYEQTITQLRMNKVPGKTFKRKKKVVCKQYLEAALISVWLIFRGDTLPVENNVLRLLPLIAITTKHMHGHQFHNDRGEILTYK